MNCDLVRREGLDLAYPAARAMTPDPEAEEDQRDAEDERVNADQPDEGEQSCPWQDRKEHPDEH